MASKYNKQGDEITRHAFISNMEAYINRLLKGELHAQPNEYLKSHGITGEMILKKLLDDKILTRKESIRTDKDTKKDKFYIKYTLPNKQDIEKKLRNLYIKLFEYHITDNQLLNEDGEGGCCGDCAGATNAESSGQFVQPLFGKPVRRSIHNVSDTKKPNKKKHHKKQQSKNLNESMKIYITERQLKAIRKAYKSKEFKDFVDKCHKEEHLDEEAEMGTAFGDFGFDAPAFSDAETRDHSNMFAKSWNGGKKNRLKRRRHHRHSLEEGKFSDALKKLGLGAAIMGGVAGGMSSCEFPTGEYDEPEYEQEADTLNPSAWGNHDFGDYENHEILGKRSPYSNCKGQLYCIEYYCDGKEDGHKYPSLETRWVDEECYNKYEVGDIFEDYAEWPTQQTGYNK